MRRDEELEQLRRLVKRARARGLTFKAIGEKAEMSSSNLGTFASGQRGLAPESRARLFASLKSFGISDDTGAAADVAATDPFARGVPDEVLRALREKLKSVLAAGVSQAEIGKRAGAGFLGSGISNFLKERRGLSPDAYRGLRLALDELSGAAPAAPTPQAPPAEEPASEETSSPDDEHGSKSSPDDELPPVRTKASEEAKQAVRDQMNKAYKSSRVNMSEFARRLGMPTGTTAYFMRGQSVSQEMLDKFRERLALFLEGKDPPPREPVKPRAGKGADTYKGQRLVIRKQLKKLLVGEHKGDYGAMARDLGLQAAHIRRVLQGGRLGLEDAERLWTRWFPDTPWAAGKRVPKAAAPAPEPESRQLSLALVPAAPNGALRRVATNGHALADGATAGQIAEAAASMLEGWKTQAMEFVVNLAKQHRGGMTND
jgi:transcriptional regulator with XRE-family HTH domain